MPEEITIPNYNTTARGLSSSSVDFLARVYEILYGAFGPQHWWPAETPFEVAVGAILTQNTNWGNVERAISNLKNTEALEPHVLHSMPRHELSALIKPSGYHNVKAARLKAFIEFLVSRFDGVIENMKAHDATALRASLLEVKGIGPETADSILLYALDKPIFVIDAYTKRILSRHSILEYKRPYGDFQALFHNSAIAHAAYNDYHALFVRLGKYYCKPRPLCDECPLKGIYP
ncbi:MAG: endonuclease III domain-containing protein [Nitrospirae bacterium]|nr:endonuclease III domain-containing protein [Nitrospirota bacterium]